MTQTMHGYIIEVRESDGNDCTVFDYITEAATPEAASDELAALLGRKAKDGDWEPDGSGGYYFPCDCENPEPDEPMFPCPQCQAVSINGVPCHETGCPIEARYNRALRQYENFECPGHGGITVSEPEEFADLEAAETEHAENRYYHSEF